MCQFATFFLQENTLYPILNLRNILRVYRELFLGSMFQLYITIRQDNNTKRTVWY